VLNADEKQNCVNLLFKCKVGRGLLFHWPGVSVCLCCPPLPSVCFSTLQNLRVSLAPDFLLDRLGDLQLVHGLVLTLDDFSDRGHSFDLQPTRDERCELLNLPNAFLTVDKLSCLTTFVQLLLEHVHLQRPCPAHLEYEADLAGQTRHGLVALSVHLRFNRVLNLLFLFSHFVLHFLYHPESLDRQARLLAQRLQLLVFAADLLFSHGLVGMGLRKRVLNEGRNRRLREEVIHVLAADCRGRCFELGFFNGGDLSVRIE